MQIEKTEARYCKCGNSIHPVRLSYGYNSCVSCSQTKRVACSHVISGKTGNTIQIVSEETAKELDRLDRRKQW